MVDGAGMLGLSAAEIHSEWTDAHIRTTDFHGNGEADDIERRISPRAGARRAAHGHDQPAFNNAPSRSNSAPIRASSMFSNRSPT